MSFKYEKQPEKECCLDYCLGRAGFKPAPACSKIQNQTAD